MDVFFEALGGFLYWTLQRKGFLKIILAGLIFATLCLFVAIIF